MPVFDFNAKKEEAVKSQDFEKALTKYTLINC